MLPYERAARAPASACLAVGALVGAAIAILTLDPAFIAGTAGKWQRPQDDLMQYVVAWRYFVAEPWRWPLFSLPGMGYPEGGSVLFMDALPLGVLASKLLYRVSGVLVNPFGWWTFVTHVLQGLMAARVMLALGVRSVVASGAAGVLVVCCTAFLSRLGHTALSSHFLILWSLALYFEMTRARRAKPRALSMLLLVTLLVNPYLFVMAALVGLAALVALWQQRAILPRDVARLAVGLALVLAVGLSAGYGFMFTHPTTMTAEGLGVFSWNPVSSYWGGTGSAERSAT